MGVNIIDEILYGKNRKKEPAATGSLAAAEPAGKQPATQQKPAQKKKQKAPQIVDLENLAKVSQNRISENPGGGRLVEVGTYIPAPPPVQSLQDAQPVKSGQTGQNRPAPQSLGNVVERTPEQQAAVERTLDLAAAKNIKGNDGGGRMVRTAGGRERYSAPDNLAELPTTPRDNRSDWERRDKSKDNFMQRMLSTAMERNEYQYKNASEIPAAKRNEQLDYLFSNTSPDSRSKTGTPDYSSFVDKARKHGYSGKEIENYLKTARKADIPLVPTGEGFTGGVAEIGRGAARGLAQGAGDIAKAGQWFAPEGSELEGIFKDISKRIEDHVERNPQLYMESDKNMSRVWYSPMKVLVGGPEMVGRMAPGMLLGGAGVPLQFWGSTAQDKYDEISRKKPEMSEAKKIAYATGEGIVQGGLEWLQTKIPAITLGKFLPGKTKGEILRKAAGVVKSGKKDLIGALGLAYLEELATETGQDMGSKELDYISGLEQEGVSIGDIVESLKVNAGPILFTTLFLSGPAYSSDARKRKAIGDALTMSPDKVKPQVRLAALKELYQVAAQKDKALADEWLRQALPLALENRPLAIPTDEDVLPKPKSGALERNIENGAVVDESYGGMTVKPGEMPEVEPPATPEEQKYRDDMDKFAAVLAGMEDAPQEDIDAIQEAVMEKLTDPDLTPDQMQAIIDSGVLDTLGIEPPTAPPAEKPEQGSTDSGEGSFSLPSPEGGFSEDEWNTQVQRAMEYNQIRNRPKRQLTPAEKAFLEEYEKGNESASMYPGGPPAPAEQVSDEEARRHEEEVSRYRWRQRMNALERGEKLRKENADKILKDESIPDEVKKQAEDRAKEIVDSDPVYQHLAEAKRRGGISLDEFKDAYDFTTVATIQKRYPGVLSRSGKIMPDEFADEMGYSSEVEMVDRFGEARTKKDLRAQIVQDLHDQWRAAEEQQKEDVGEYFKRQGEAEQFYDTAYQDKTAGVPSFPASDNEVSAVVDFVESTAGKFTPEELMDMADDWRFTSSQRATITKAIKGAVARQVIEEKEKGAGRKGAPSQRAKDIASRLKTRGANEQTQEEQQAGQEETGPAETGTAEGGRVETVDNPESVADGQEVNVEPTDGQKEAGNYKKPHVSIDGLNITIENPVGTERSGVDEKGRKWSQVLANDYGYILQTEAIDGDHVDVFIVNGYQGGAKKVYIVNQYKEDGTFDEPKVILGAKSKGEARRTYLANYEKGWNGGKEIVFMSMDDFKKWVKSDAPKKGPATGGRRKKSDSPGVKTETRPSEEASAAFTSNTEPPADADTIREIISSLKKYKTTRDLSEHFELLAYQALAKPGEKFTKKMLNRYTTTEQYKGIYPELKKQWDKVAKAEQAEQGAVHPERRANGKWWLKLTNFKGNAYVNDGNGLFGGPREFDTKTEAEDWAKENLSTPDVSTRGAGQETATASSSELYVLNEQEKDNLARWAKTSMSKVRHELKSLIKSLNNSTGIIEKQLESGTNKHGDKLTDEMITTRRRVIAQNNEKIRLIKEYLAKEESQAKEPQQPTIDDEINNVTEDELNAMLGIETTPEKTEKDAADIIGEAAKAGVKGVDEALTGLYELFGGSSLKSFPAGLDEDTYKAAKPHFEEALKQFRKSGQSLKELIDFLLKNMSDKIAPYIKHWVMERQQEAAGKKEGEKQETPAEREVRLAKVDMMRKRREYNKNPTDENKAALEKAEKRLRDARNNPALFEGESEKPKGEKDVQTFIKRLNERGVAYGPDGTKYSIQQNGPDQGFYMRIEKDGVRTEKGGVAPDGSGWTRQQAIDKIVGSAFPGHEQEETATPPTDNKALTIRDLGDVGAKVQFKTGFNDDIYTITNIRENDGFVQINDDGPYRAPGEFKKAITVEAFDNAEVFENKDDGVKSLVARNKETGEYHVTLIDMDSGLVVDGGFITSDEAQAIKKAKEWAGIKGKAAPGKTWKNPVHIADYLLSIRMNNGWHLKTISQVRRKVAEHFGLNADEADKGEFKKKVDEAVEYAVVQVSRDKVSAGIKAGLSATQIFDQLVKVYEDQPRLGVRTSTSTKNQAYSTPVPIAWLANYLGDMYDQRPGRIVYEPTAGTGMLLIGASPDSVAANELDGTRADLLEAQGFLVTRDDATEQDHIDLLNVDRVIANPPFGTVKEPDGKQKKWKIDGFTTRQVDQAISLHALKALKDDGKAVLIIGGLSKQVPHDKRAKKYGAKAKKDFFKVLYNEYNVVDHFTVAGELYGKQGAGWPIDIIVIDRKGQSDKATPDFAAPPVYKTFDEIRGKLDEIEKGDATNFGVDATREEQEAADTERGPRTVATGSAFSNIGANSDAVSGGTGLASGAGGTGRPVRFPGTAGSAGSDATGNQGHGGGGRGSSAGRPNATGNNGNRQPGTGNVPGSGQSEQAGGSTGGTGTSGQPDSNGVAGSTGGGSKRPVASEGQSLYTPSSSGQQIGTLTPTNLSSSIKAALDKLAEVHGSVDNYVVEKLQYPSAKELHNALSAEQIDAVALAISNIESGYGFVIGDQTGVGKGRVVASIIKYSLLQGKPPVFVTEKQGLYADMYRDLVDIGMDPAIVKDIMQTNNKSVTLDPENGIKLTSPAGWNNTLANAEGMPVVGKGKNKVQKKIVFTTYDQLNIGAKDGAENLPPRRKFLSRLVRRENVILIMDESHNAGGSGDLKNLKADKDTGIVPYPRALFFRDIINNANGVLYSSATYAKNPDVMDLYRATDLILGVSGDVDALADAIKKGGIPFQGITASMLAESGQYIRRERSFDGVEYSPKTVRVNTAHAEGVSALMSEIRAFEDEFIAGVLETDEQAQGSTALGEGGQQSQNFTSLMHNIINQALLSLKVGPSVQEAIKILQEGEKENEQVVLTVANTMGSFLKDYVAEKGLVEGDVVDLAFNDFLFRYLYKTREYTIKGVKDKNGKPVHFFITDEELGPAGVAAYKRVEKAIYDMDLSGMPVSPVDYMLNELKKAGYPWLEITGRDWGIDYSGDQPTLYRRSGKEKSVDGRNLTIRQFNNGEKRAIILNKSGSTGISLHASERNPENGRGRRTMLVVQAEADINTHMQMLGRIHRTGQVVPPRYLQMVADIPAERKPAAVLLSKMAGLNANTTANADSAFTDKETVNFMNKYGDRIAANMLKGNPQLNKMLGSPYGGDKSSFIVGLAKKVTGRLPLLTIEQQEHVYQELEAAYEDLIAELDATGRNDLVTKTYDLDAKTLETFEVSPSTGASPFQSEVVAETVDMKRIGMPYSSKEVRKLTKQNYGNGEFEASEALNNYPEFVRSQLAELQERIDNEEDAGIKAKLTEHKEHRERAFRKTEREFKSLNRIFKVGKPVRIAMDMGTGPMVLDGVVVDKKATGKTVNPLALSGWRVTIAVADGIRSITLPMSRFEERYSEVDANGSGRIGVEPVTGSSARLEEIFSSFDNALRVSRERRIIITGNIFTGFSLFSGEGGQIINFTRDNGEIAQGVLMPRRFDPGVALDSRPVVIPNADTAIAYFNAVGNSLLELNRSGDVRITQSVTGSTPTLRLTTAGAVRSAGRYFRDDRALLDIVGEFHSVGSRMTTDPLTEDQVRQVFELFTSRGAAWSAKDNLDTARRLVEENNRNDGGGDGVMYSKAGDMSAGWTVDRIGHAIRAAEYPNGTTKAVIGWINPDDFLAATTPFEGWREDIERDTKDLDISELAEETQTPFLLVDGDRIVGHEGRHRMIALARAGVTSVPVVIDYRAAEYRDEVSELTFKGQQASKYNQETGDYGEPVSGADMSVRDVIPLASEYRGKLSKKMAGNDIVFAKSPTPTGTTVRQARRAVRKFLGGKGYRKLVDGGVLKIVQSMKDAGTGVALYSGSGRIAGFYDQKTGSITLIADNIKPDEVEDVLIHEYSHRALDSDPKFIKDREKILSSLDRFKGKQGEAVKAAREKAIRAEGKNADPDLIRQETLAYFLQEKKNRTLPLYRRIIAAVKRALRRIGIPTGKLTADDIVSMFVAWIKKDARRGRKAEATGINEFAQGVKTSLSEAKEKITDNPNFKKWFGDSKVVDENGEPLVVYRGLQQPMKGIMDGAAVFSDSPVIASDYAMDDVSGSNVTPVYLNISSPLTRNDSAITASEAYEMLDAAGLNEGEINRFLDTIPNWRGGDIHPTDYQTALESGNQDEFYTDFFYFLDEKDFKDMLMDQGYDGAIFPSLFYGRNTSPEELAQYPGSFDSAIDEALEYWPFSPTQIKSIFNTGEFSPTNPDILKSYAGKESATADQSKLFDAIRMHKFGEDGEKIRQDTGWHLGKDNRWRYEIDDSQARSLPLGNLETEHFGDQKVITGKLSDVLDHPELFKAYPKLKDIDVFIYPEANPNGIEAGFTSGDPGSIDVHGIGDKLLLMGDKKAALLHEIQHAIQNIEGFSFGGSPELLAQDKEYLPTGYAYILDREIRRVENYGRRFQRVKRRDGKWITSINDAKRELQIVKQMNAVRDYYRLFGEIEARDTATRKDLTPEQRKALPPYTSEGIPMEDAIVRFSGDRDAGNVMFSRMETTEQKQKIKKEYTNIRGTENLNATRDGVKSSASESIGNQLIALMYDKLATVSSPSAAKRYNRQELHKVLDAYREVARVIKDPAASIAEKQKFAAAFATKLPKEPRALLLKRLAQISRVKRPATQLKRLNGFLKRADRVMSDHYRRKMMAKIKERSKKPKLKKDRMARGHGDVLERDLRYLRETVLKLEGNDAVLAEQANLDALYISKQKELLAAKNDVHKNKILEEIDDLESFSAILDVFGDLKNKDFYGVLEAYNKLEDIISKEGSLWRQMQDEWRERNASNREFALKEITGLENPERETLAEQRDRLDRERSFKGKVKEALSSAENMIQSFELLMDKISSKSGAKILGSQLVKHFGSLVHAATRKYERMQFETNEMLSNKAMEIFKVKDRKELGREFARLNKVVKGGVFTYPPDKPRKQALNISPMQAAYFYQIGKDIDNPIVRATFKKMGVTDKTLKQIEKMIGPKLKAWADYLVDEFYQDFHTETNNVYRQMYGIDLEKTENYVPWYREVVGKESDMDIIGFLASVENGTLKKSGLHQRVPNTKEFRVMNINDVLINHVTDMNHFKAWALPVREINGTFNSPEVQRAIRQNYGASTLRAVKAFQNDFAKSPREILREKVGFLDFDRIRSRLTVSLIGANPTIFLKQLTSIPAYAAEIPVGAWTRGTGYALSHPVEVARILGESQMMKSRYLRGFERDVANAMKRGSGDVLSMKRGFGEKMMKLTALGDKAAILMGGYAVYDYHKQQALKAEKSEQEAHKIGLEEFEKATERSQQSSNVKDLGEVQRGGPLLKLFTMFMTTPASYTRLMHTAVRHLANGSDRAKAVKMLAIYGVILPAVFKAVGDALLLHGGGDDDDKGKNKYKMVKDMAEGVALSPFIGLPFVRTVAEASADIAGAYLWDVASGSKSRHHRVGFKGEFSPVVSILTRLYYGQDNLGRALTGGTKRIDADEYLLRAMWDFAEVTGNLTGIPLRPMKNIATGAYDVATGNTEYPVRRLLGYSRSAVGEKK